MARAGKKTDNRRSAITDKGFLESLYLDKFDKRRFLGLSFPPADPRAENIIHRYRELIREYPPTKLEKEGSIPDKLMDGLKEIGLFGLNIPREYGGVGLDVSGYLSVLRAMARTDTALALTPTAHLSIGAQGDPPLRERGSE